MSAAAANPAVTPRGRIGRRLASPDEEASRRRYDLAGIAVEFTSTDPGWVAQLSRRYEGFETEAAPAFAVRYEVVEGETPLPDRPYGELHPTAAGGSGRIELAGPGFVLSADLAAGTAVIAGPRHTYPVDAAMRELLPVLVSDGLLLHTALATDGRRAWACSGPSGSGKSTLAALLAERALCDELALLRVGPGGIEARSLPYWTARPGRAPLAGIHLLRHGPEHRRTRIAPEAAARRLLAQVVWPTRFPDAMARALETAAVIAELVPVWELEFAPRSDVAAAVFVRE